MTEINYSEHAPLAGRRRGPMVSSVRKFAPRFADSEDVKEGVVLAMNLKGDEQMVVIAPPIRIKNVVGGRTFVKLLVRLPGIEVAGEMIYRASEVVYLRTNEEAQLPV